MANSYLQFSSFCKRTDRFGVSLKCCSPLWRTWMVVAVGSFLALSYFKIKNRRHCIFFRWSFKGFKAEPNELLAKRFCLKLSFLKWSVQTRKCFVIWNDFLFILFNHSLLKFSSFGKLNELILHLKLLLHLIAAQNTMVFC